jgi:beta-glucosidase-like glycosyl hydrolase
MTRSSASTTAGPSSAGSTRLARRPARPAPPPAARWILGFAGASLPRKLAQAIAGGRVDGLALFRDNTGGSVAGARELRREILSLAPKGRPFIFTADEEGGLISQTSRLTLPDGGVWSSVPTPRALGRVGRPEACRFVARLLGRRLRALGVTVDFAPCLDLDTEGENPVIGSRSFGDDPARVAPLGLAFAEGLALAGVACCFKHYPGHGGTRLDSHRTLPTMDSRDRATHESPFRDCLRAVHGAAAWERRPRPWAMGAHVDWGDGVPASLNPALLGRVRRWLSDALLVTDSLEMGAVSLAAGAARQALAAGNDVLLVARGWETALAAMGEMEGEGEAGNPGRASRRGRAVLLAGEMDRRTDRRADLPLSAEDPVKLASLHLASVRLSGAPVELPKGPWTWVVPEGLAPYARLRDWKPARGRRRPCAEVVWVPESANAAFLAATARRLTEDMRPVLVATLFRGLPAVAVRDAWRPILEHPRVRVVAHLLDEGWPARGEQAGMATGASVAGSGPSAEAGLATGVSSSGAGAPVVVALTSGPSVESLDALAAALGLPDEAWRPGQDGLHFVVDSGRTSLAK